MRTGLHGAYKCYFRDGQNDEALSKIRTVTVRAPPLPDNVVVEEDPEAEQPEPEKSPRPISEPGEPEGRRARAVMAAIAEDIRVRT